MTQPPSPDPQASPSRRDRRRRQRDRTSAQPNASGSVLGAIVVLVYRVLVVGASLGVGLVGGAAVAQRFPQSNPSPPFAERVRSQVVAVFTPAPSTEPTPPELELDRLEIQTRLEELDRQLAELDRQISALEPTAGDADAEQPLQQIDQQMRAVREQQQRVADLLPEATPVSADRPLRLTLPSDVLFAEDDSTLSDNSDSILNSLLDELQAYDRGTVYIAGYSDASDRSTAALDRSFAQAQAVEQYLRDSLDNSLRWVAVGYGASRFAAANDTPANRRRNRRIEIRIRPRP